jgi:hypothetical protein
VATWSTLLSTWSACAKDNRRAAGKDTRPAGPHATETATDESQQATLTGGVSSSDGTALPMPTRPAWPTWAAWGAWPGGRRVGVSVPLCCLSSTYQTLRKGLGMDLALQFPSLPLCFAVRTAELCRITARSHAVPQRSSTSSSSSFSLLPTASFASPPGHPKDAACTAHLHSGRSPLRNLIPKCADGHARFPRQLSLRSCVAQENDARPANPPPPLPLPCTPHSICLSPPSPLIVGPAADGVSRQTAATSARVAWRHWHSTLNAAVEKALPGATL